MFKRGKAKFLSIIMSLLLLFTNLTGVGGQNVVMAQTSTVISQGFDGVTNSVPSGWTFNGTVGTYTSVNNYGNASPSFKFGTTGNQLVSPSFNLSGQADLSFWIKGQGTDANSHLLVEKFGGTSWNPVEDIKPLPTTGTTKTYKLESNIKQVRFTYTKSAGNVALDDVSITQNSTTPPATTVNVQSVTLDEQSIDLSVSASTNLQATITPSDATDKNVTWSSDNEPVATVDEHSGLITGVSEGTANITVTTEDGNKKATCAVKVVPSSGKTFDIVEITDFHGQLLNSTNTYYIGAALSKAVKDIKAANPQRTLIISGGDNYQGTPLSNVLYGAPVRDVFNDMGLQVTALGNHEFDWGLNKLIDKTMQGANYQILCANLYKKGTNERVFEPYKVITEDGVRIAVIGAITNETPTIVLPANVADYDFKDAATEINSVAKSIRDNNKADVVIAVVHEGSSALNSIVSNLHGVDAVFGGHSHTSLDTVCQDADGKNVPTFNAASTGKGYVDLKLTVNTSDNSLSFSSKGSNYKSLTVNSSTPLDPNAKAIIDEANKDIAPIFSEPIGNTTVALTKDQAAQPYGESQLGNWMSDVVKNYAKADVGMVNNGGIRLSPIPAGQITVGTIFYLMPFDNTVCTVNMNGAQLRVLLEQAVQDNGKGIQVSGIKFTYDSSKQSYKPAVVDSTTGQVTTPAVPGQRITKIVKESDGSVINDNDILKVAAPDFMATGGDTFTEFVDDPVVKTTFVDSHYTVRDALIDDVKAAGTIPNEMPGRIVNAAGSTGAATEMTIAEARAAASGNAILTGIVTAVSGKNVFMQDSTAGICLYNSAGAVVKKGDSIKVTGPLSVFNGLTEITPAAASNVQVLSSDNTVTPKVVTIAQIADALQGQLIKVNGATLNNIDTAGSSVIQDNTGSVVIFKIPELNGIAEGDQVDVTAAVSKYGSTIELLVGDAADVVKTGSIPVTTPSATIAIIATSDMHGNIYNYDYASGAAPSKGQGLAKVSTYVKGVRAANPNVMLIDDGDTIQGTPLSYYYDMIDKTSEYPMMKVMGAMGYDTWTLGNHEFNYGMDTLNRIITDAKKEGIHVLSANTYKEDNSNFVNPYYTKSFTVNGKTIKVGILGLTTKCIPNWEDPAHYAGLHFNDLVDEAKKWVPVLRKDEKCDVIIVAAHSGEEGASDVIPENEIKAIATQVSGIDAIVAGHVHNVVNDLTLKNPEGQVVPVVEPGKWGNDVSEIDINIDETGAISGLKTKNVVMNNTYPEDAAIKTLAEPYEDQTLQYIKTVLGTSSGEFKGAGQYVAPTAIMDLVNKVQMDAAGTQLSIAAPLSASAYIPQGDVTIKDIMSVYVYENFLYGIKMTGKQLKNWMEYSVRYYKQINDPNLKIDATTDYKTLKDTTMNIADYNLDQLYGATYDIDLTEPACTLDADGKVTAGNRIKNLKVNGVPVKDDDVFTVAINNYRYNGGGGFMTAVGLSNTDPSLVTYDSAKALGDDGQVRSLMMSYIQKNKTIDPSCSNSWQLSAAPIEEAKPDFDIENITGEANFKAGNDAEVKVKATNETDSSKDATLIIVLFQGNKFVNYVKCSQSIDAGKSVILDGGFTIPSGQGYSIKCMVWKSLDDPTPLSDYFELPVAN